MRMVRTALALLPLVACGDDSSDNIAFDGGCEFTYTTEPPEVGDPATRTRLLILSTCNYGDLGMFNGVTNMTSDDNGDGTADWTGESLYTASSGDQLGASFTGTATFTGEDAGEFDGTETYQGGTGIYEDTTGDADVVGSFSGGSGSTTVDGQASLQ